MDSRLGDLSDSPVTWIPGLATYLIVPLPGGRTWRCCRRRSRIPTRPRHPPHWGTCPRTGLAHHQSSLKDNQEKVVRYLIKYKLLNYLVQVLRRRNYLFSAPTPAPPLSFISAPAPAPAKYSVLRIRNEFSEFRIRIQAKVPDPCGSGSRSNLF